LTDIPILVLNEAEEIGCRFPFDIEIIFFTFFQLAGLLPTGSHERGLHEQVPLLHSSLSFILNLSLLPSAVLKPDERPMLKLPYQSNRWWDAEFRGPHLWSRAASHQVMATGL
jgi:hypothetical protein